MEKFLNVKDLANYLNCSESFVRKLISSNQIPYFKIGSKILFKLSSIEEWIDEK